MEREIELGLVARIRTGDSAAFEIVYEAFRARLFSFLVRLSRRRDVAEDLLEETWLRFVARAGDLSADTCLAAWLYTVARNLHASWCRNRALHEERISDLTPSWPALVPGETPFEAASSLGLTPEALRKRLQRARERLAIEMAEEAAPPQAKAG